MNTRPEICCDRAVIITEADRELAGWPVLMRRAEAFQRILKRMRIYILEGELIVGNQGSKPRSAPIFPEFSVDWILEELDDFSRRKYDPFQLDDECKAKLKEVCKYWKGKTHFDRVCALTRMILPESVGQHYDANSLSLDKVFSTITSSTAGDGHIVADYESILKKGLTTFIGIARQEISLAYARPDIDVNRIAFLNAVTVSCGAVISFAERFAVLAEEMAERAVDDLKKTELLNVAAHCRRVPAHAARTFHEALQSVWFIHLAMQIESNGHGMSLGRFDQYLYPFLGKDRENGTIDEGKAIELLECFWLKCCEINKVRKWTSTEFKSGYPMFQTLTIGGQDIKGFDATNELSFLSLKATRNLRVTQPTVVVRIHNKTPENFLEACVETMVLHGGGLPGFFNDEVAIPSMMSVGVNLEDARNWAVVGCSEPTVPGKHAPVTGGVLYISLLKLLELALNDGKNLLTGNRLCPGMGNLADFANFDQVMEAYNIQNRFYAKLIAVLSNIAALTYAELTPTPFLSSIIQGRIQSGRDVSQGGPPNYNCTAVQVHNVANVADALAAIKKLVFEEHLISARELQVALQNDFSGPSGEKIRQLLVSKAPKYGNNDDYVDHLAVQVSNVFFHELSKYRTVRGGTFGATGQSLTANVPEGRYISATPDGRKAGSPTSDNTSPTPGMDRNGITACLASVSKLDHQRFTMGSLLNIKFHPSIFVNPKGYRKVAALIKAYFEMKGFQVQFNVVSADQLREAQKNPDEYRDLIVKVAGYSALFNSLDRELQDQIITRTEHRL
jgi:formate C-acetyltransferase